MRKILFIGNYLELSRGTVGPSVFLMEKFKRDGYKVYKASSRKNKIFRISEMCRKSCFADYDTIIIDVYSTTAIIFADVCSIIAYMRNKKIICILHGGGLPDVYQDKAVRIKRILQRATVITTPSMYLQRFFQEHGFEVEYIPNSIDLVRFPFNTERPNNHSILWVRAFTKIYNPDVAVKVLCLVKKEYPDASMTMVGPDKGSREETMNLILQLGLSESIKFTGKIPNEQLFEYYHSHDVYLNTTSLESFGVAVLEAASCGTPIVSTSVGEIPIMWEDGEDILLGGDKNEQELAEKVCLLFCNKALYEKIREKAREKTAQYTWEHVGELWKDVLGI